MGGILPRLEQVRWPEMSHAEGSGSRRSLPSEAEQMYQGGTGFTDLPEACVALILAHVGSADDVIRLALVSRLFRDASRSDTVWERVLPCNYAEVVRDAANGPIRYRSKKELFDILLKGIYLGDGYQAFWLEPPTGALCLMQSAKALSIVWGDDPRYWKWVSKPGSRFQEVAHLDTVCWLEVRGQLTCQLPPGRYSLSWRMQMSEALTIPRRGIYNPLRFPQSHIMGSNAHAWNHKPVKFHLLTGDGQQADSARYLDGQLTASERQLTLSNLAIVVDDKDKWMEYVVGEFVVDSEGIVDLQFSMMEIEGGDWKGGLFLDGVAIRPVRQT